MLMAVVCSMTIQTHVCIRLIVERWSEACWCLYKIDNSGLHHDKTNTCMYKIIRSGLQQAIQVPVCTRLLAVLWSEAGYSGIQLDKTIT